MAKPNLKQDKSLGQHWLVDEMILDKIALSLEGFDYDAILEVGPGKGALTSYLLKKIKSEGKHLFAVEFDERMYQHLQKQYKENNNITIINQDYLKFNEEELLPHPGASTCPISSDQLADGEGVKEASKKMQFFNYIIIANLPYNISSPIFNKLITAKLKPAGAALLVQKEVAVRLASGAGQRNSSPLSIELNNYYETELGIVVPKEAFDPPPKVTSQVIKLKLREETVFGENLAGVMKLVRLGFKMRRKKLINNLASLSISNQNLSLILAELNIETSIRAEQMTNKQWLELYLYFKDRGVLK